MSPLMVSLPSMAAAVGLIRPAMMSVQVVMSIPISTSVGALGSVAA